MMFVAAMLEAVQFGFAGALDWGKNLAGGAIPAIVVYSITKRDVRVAKEQTSTAREEAKKEFAEAIAPALNAFKYEFKDELLRGMNGTYLRTAEARVHFQNIEKSFERLENLVLRGPE